MLLFEDIAFFEAAVGVANLFCFIITEARYRRYFEKGPLLLLCASSASDSARSGRF